MVGPPAAGRLNSATRYDYEYWLRREVERTPALFSLPEVVELLPPELRKLPEMQDSSFNGRAETAPARGAPGAGPDIQVALPATFVDLTINLLGPTEIFRDPARPFAADAWTTRRARDILCFIASRRHRRASKQVLIETFWNEAEGPVAEKNFYPTISHIRRALNNNQLLKQNFLLFSDGEYQLNSEFAYRIDLEEFDRLVSESEAARRSGQSAQCLSAYEAASKLYRGAFMQGCYGSWVEEQQAYYREQFLFMLEAQIVAAQKSGAWAQSLLLAQRVQHEDPFREEVYCRAMRAYAALGNRAAVKEQYETLRRLLREELGIEPAARTRKIFKQLFDPEVI